MNWWRALPDLLTREDLVLVTVAHTQGSVPREAGASMLVTLTSTVDTIGGGHLEWEAMAQARAMLLQPAAAPSMQRLSLGASLGQCCGGVVWLVFERVGQLSREEWLARVVQLESGVVQHRVLASSGVHSVWSSSLEDAAERSPGACLQTYPSPSPAPDGAPSPSGRGNSYAQARLQQCPPPGGRVPRQGRERGDVTSNDTPPLQPASSTKQERRGTGRGEMPQTWQLSQTVQPNTFPITIFGAGHVGAAIVQLLATLDAQIRWVDPRDDQFGSAPAHVKCIATDTPEEAIATAPANSFFLVLTHSHALDLTLSEHILRRNDFAWFGLVGSQTKRARFEHRLHALGLDTTRMQCPIGIPGIRDKSPEAIAIAVVAQVLQVREARASVRNQGAAISC